MSWWKRKRSNNVDEEPIDFNANPFYPHEHICHKKNCDNKSVKLDTWYMHVPDGIHMFTAHACQQHKRNISTKEEWDEYETNYRFVVASIHRAKEY